MAVVKGSNQQRLEVVSYDPAAKRKRYFYLFLLLLLSLAASYFLGQYNSLKSLSSLKQQLEESTLHLSDAQLEVQNYSQRNSLLEKGGEVDRAASDTIRATVKDFKEQIAVLQEEVAFYKGIMAPTGKDKGLRIDKMDIAANAEQGRFNYSLMITQVADNSSSITGVVVVSVIGTADGQEKTISLRDLDATVNETGVKFRFRYFQEIAGVVEFPAGFTPEKVVVVAQSSGKKAQRVEKTLPWPKGNNNV